MCIFTCANSALSWDPLKHPNNLQVVFMTPWNAPEIAWNPLEFSEMPWDLLKALLISPGMPEIDPWNARRIPRDSLGPQKFLVPWSPMDRPLNTPLKSPEMPMSPLKRPKDHPNFRWNLMEPQGSLKRLSELQVDPNTPRNAPDNSRYPLKPP